MNQINKTTAKATAFGNSLTTAILIGTLAAMPMGNIQSQVAEDEDVQQSCWFEFPLPKGYIRWETPSNLPQGTGDMWNIVGNEVWGWAPCDVVNIWQTYYDGVAAAERNFEKSKERATELGWIAAVGAIAATGVSMAKSGAQGAVTGGLAGAGLAMGVSATYGAIGIGTIVLGVAASHRHAAEDLVEDLANLEQTRGRALDQLAR